jgi:CheY-like chemotaxis protein
MLIDDSSIDQMLYARVIERSGLINKTLTYSYAEDALRQLRSDDEEQIDAIFLDINMPRMNGFDFLDTACTEFGGQFTKIVVIMLTTSLNPDDVQRAKDYNVVKEYINKPLTAEHIQRVVAIVDAQA